MKLHSILHNSLSNNCLNRIWQTKFHLNKNFFDFSSIFDFNFQIDSSLDALNKLMKEYDFVNTKTSSLNIASENLTQEQCQLNLISEDIRFRLKHFTQAEHLTQRLQNPTFSAASDQFVDIMNSIDECLDYMKNHVSKSWKISNNFNWIWIIRSHTSKKLQHSVSNTNNVYWNRSKWLRTTSFRCWHLPPTRF